MAAEVAPVAAPLYEVKPTERFDRAIDGTKVVVRLPKAKAPK